MQPYDRDNSNDYSQNDRVVEKETSSLVIYLVGWAIIIALIILWVLWPTVGAITTGIAIMAFWEGQSKKK